MDLDPGSHPCRDDGDETLDPGSRPESQRVTSCANRLVVKSGAYRETIKEAKTRQDLDPGSTAYREDVEVGHTGMTVRWDIPGRR